MTLSYIADASCLPLSVSETYLFVLSLSSSFRHTFEMPFGPMRKEYIHLSSLLSSMRMLTRPSFSSFSRSMRVCLGVILRLRPRFRAGTSTLLFLSSLSRSSVSRSSALSLSLPYLLPPHITVFMVIIVCISCLYYIRQWRH